MKQITSRDNPAFKRLRALSEDARARREAAATLLDGAHLLTVALDHGCELPCVVVTPDSRSKPEIAVLLARPELARAQLLEMPAALLRALSPVEHPSGVVAELRIPAAPIADTGDVLVLAGVQDTGNLGTLLRTAAAAGIRRAWLSAECTQAWSPKALRAGMGAQFFMDIEERVALAERLAGFSGQIIATALSEKTVPLYALDLRPDTAWIFGSEGQGVPPALQAQAQILTGIPMPGGMESLNVAAAAAVCLFEQVRQRRLHNGA
ncbi:MAG: RNA methyltransferase [Rhodocyclaceae bacterium]